MYIFYYLTDSVRREFLRAHSGWAYMSSHWTHMSGGIYVPKHTVSWIGGSREEQQEEQPSYTLFLSDPLN